MSEDVQAMCDAYDALVADAIALVGPLDDARANAQPGGGTRWSVAQNLDHLTRANAAYLDTLRPALDRARRAGRLRRRPLAPGAPGRWFLGALEPPPRMRVRAPRSIQPASTFTAAAVLDAFCASVVSARELLLASADLDLNGTRFQNPFVPLVQVRASTGFLILAAHGRRHLWQARQALAQSHTG